MLKRFISLCMISAIAFGMALTSASAQMLPTAAPPSTAMEYGQRVLPPIGHITFCAANPRQCEVAGQHQIASLDNKSWRQMLRVNVLVNQAIIQQADAAHAGSDHWTLAPRYGDCEDYALTKRAQLIRLGWPTSSLLLATAYAPGFGHHAVLVVRTDAGDYVLDNLSNHIMAWSETGYDWRQIQSPTNPTHWLAI